MKLIRRKKVCVDFKAEWHAGIIEDANNLERRTIDKQLEDHTHTHTHTHIYIYIYLHIRSCIYIHAHTNAYIYVCVCGCVYVCIWVCDTNFENDFHLTTSITFNKITVFRFWNVVRGPNFPSYPYDDVLFPANISPIYSKIKKERVNCNKLFGSESRSIAIDRKSVYILISHFFLSRNQSHRKISYLMTDLKLSAHWWKCTSKFGGHRI